MTTAVVGCACRACAHRYEPVLKVNKWQPQCKCGWSSPAVKLVAKARDLFDVHRDEVDPW